MDGGGPLLTSRTAAPAWRAEHAAHVFERFYRVEGGLASGSGLGLAIAKELAELMGGRIELDSQNGWTLFTLVLAADADVARARRQPSRFEQIRARENGRAVFT